MGLEGLECVVLKEMSLGTGLGVAKTHVIPNYLSLPFALSYCPSSIHGQLPDCYHTQDNGLRLTFKIVRPSKHSLLSVALIMLFHHNRRVT